MPWTEIRTCEWTNEPSLDICKYKAYREISHPFILLWYYAKLTSLTKAHCCRATQFASTNNLDTLIGRRAWKSLVQRIGTQDYTLTNTWIKTWMKELKIAINLHTIITYIRIMFVVKVNLDIFLSENIFLL